MDLNAYLKGERGRSAKVARALRKSPAFVSQMALRARPVPASLVPVIEAVTGQAVRCWDLRPRDWHLIWPAAKDTPGAPLPAAEEQRHAA